jgi:hypothetical protein
MLIAFWVNSKSFSGGEEAGKGMLGHQRRYY